MLTDKSSWYTKFSSSSTILAEHRLMGYDELMCCMYRMRAVSSVPRHCFSILFVCKSITFYFLSEQPSLPLPVPEMRGEIAGAGETLTGLAWLTLMERGRSVMALLSAWGRIVLSTVSGVTGQLWGQCGRSTHIHSRWRLGKSHCLSNLWFIKPEAWGCYMGEINHVNLEDMFLGLDFPHFHTCITFQLVLVWIWNNS